MSGYEETGLWKRSLGKTETEDEIHESLRTEYGKFRERASQLASEIARDLPDFTIHDASHFDELWRLADLIAGKDFELNPMEAFVLGGAFLIHDLRLGLAAYPNGINQLRSEPNWNDTLTAILKENIGHAPSKDELESADEEIIHLATEQVLRKLHADYAEQLCLISWKDGDQKYHLIENIELRKKYGPIIGKIAQSHWLPVSKLAEIFKIRIGAVHPYPREWEIDPLKLACLLRVADASHIDSSRAPACLRAFRKPRSDSRDHWIFQDHVHQPYLENGRLFFTSGDKFPIGESASWWLGFDVLNMIDEELHQVDVLLSDSGRRRFAANGVAGAKNAQRMSEFIPTENWIPVDAQIRITDIPALIRKFGGEELYGRDSTVPLRELIQNGSDAIRARRSIEDRPSNWGDIVIRLGNDDEGDWIEVQDNGIGMSTEVLTGPLLDFGNSYWGSSLMIKEFPGLMSKGLQPAGKYGIGFFSVFMLGNHVRVTSRRFESAQSDTQVLEFDCGIDSRPILRKAHSSEFLRDGGTCVRIWLEVSPQDPNGLLRPNRRDSACSLRELCEWLCPAIDVNLYVEMENSGRESVISANDWINLSCDELLERIWILESQSKENRAKNIDAIKDIIRPISDKTGKIISRACILPRSILKYDKVHSANLGGIVCADGFRSIDLHRVIGIFVGKTIGIARDEAIPIVNYDDLANWATEQANLIFDLVSDPIDQAQCALTIRTCGGNTGKLKIAFNSMGWLNGQEIAEIFGEFEEILLLDPYVLRRLKDKFDVLELNNEALFVEFYSSPILHTELNKPHYWPDLDSDFHMQFWNRTHVGCVMAALADFWSISLDSITSALEFSREDKKIIRVIGKGNGMPISHEIRAIIRRTMIITK